MSFELLVQSPSRYRRSILLTGERLVVGRSHNAALSFPQTEGLSRHHFELKKNGGSWTIVDLASTNGTFVNDTRLEQWRTLKPGDRITAGSLVAVFSPAADASDVVIFEKGKATFSSDTTVLSTLDRALSTHSLDLSRVGTRPPAPMRALIRAGQELSQHRPLAELFPVILELAREAVNADRGVLLLIEDGQLVVKAHKGGAFRISAAVRDRVLRDKSSLLVRNAQSDTAFKNRESIVQQRVQPFMAVPLQTKEQAIGLIYLDSLSTDTEFTKEDLDLLAVMANVAAIRIENARLAEIEEAERMNIRDLEQAAEIQGRVLPDGAPHVAGLDLAGFNSACYMVGGDYYTFFPYPDGRVVIALGDVAGKGMPASLMMMALHARVRVLAEEPGDLGALLTRLNKATSPDCPSNRFVTFFICILNPAADELVFANAGHNSPLVIRASGETCALETAGPPLGIEPSTRYAQDCVPFCPGDMLVIYSDGITEAANTNSEQFGEEALLAVVRAHQREPAAAVIQAVTRSLAAFSGEAPQADDITLVVAKRI